MDSTNVVAVCYDVFRNSIIRKFIIIYCAYPSKIPSIILPSNVSPFGVGNKNIIEAMSRYQENVSSGVFNAIQLASIKALDEGDRNIDHMVEIYSRRRKLALASFEKMGISVTAGMGTFYLWAAVPNGLSSEDFSTWLLEEAHVLVTAGTAYGKYGEGYFRISLTVPDDRLAEALGRIRKALKGK